LAKHWFKYGIVFCALGIIKDLQRLDEEKESDDQDPEQTDLKKVGQVCAGLARVIVPIIRALHKGPAMLETARAAA
jgi:hypothetical protein